MKDYDEFVCPRCNVSDIEGMNSDGDMTESVDDLDKADLYRCVNCGYLGGSISFEDGGDRR